MASRRPHELTIEEFREILRLPNHLIAIIKPDGTFYKVNEEANPVLGWEPEEVIGQKVKDYVHPEDWEETYAQMTSVFLGSKALVEDMRNRIRRKDGTWRWISWTGKAKGGYIFAHGSDVTEKIEYEEALTVQSLVLESISEGVIICNDKGLIVFANTAAEKLYGYDMEELLGKKIYILSGLNEETSRAKIQEVLKGINEEQIWKGEFENVKKDGAHFQSSCRVTILDLHGERHYVCVQRDISKKKRLTREREEIETRFITFFEQSALPMIIFDLEGNPLDVNSAWELLYATPRSSLEGYNLLSDPTTKIAGLLPYVKRAIAGEQVSVPPFHIDPANVEGGREGRARWLEAWFSPILNSDGTPRELAVIIKDVTDQIETQKELQNLEAKYRVTSESLSLAVQVGKVGIWEWLPKEDKVIWDETTEAIYGYEKGTFPQTTVAYSAHLYPEDMENSWTIVSESLKNARAYTMDHRIITKAGAIRWLQGSGMPFYNEQGEVIRVLGTTLDITDRKEQEEDQKFISDISDILSSSFDYTQNIQKVLDLTVKKYFDGAIVDEIRGNRSLRISAASNDPVKQALLFEIHRKHYSDLNLDHPHLNSLVHQKELVFEDIDVLLKSSQFNESYQKDAAELNMKSGLVHTLQGKHGPLGVVSFHIRKDNQGKLTERHKKVGREVAYRISLAIENSLLYHHSQEAIRARDEFLSIASHELKTPLQSLTLQNQMRRRMIEKEMAESVNPSSLLKTLDMDKRQLTRINRLIDDMLDISRIKNAKLSLQKEKFNLASLVNDITERLRPQIESAGCDLRKEFSSHPEIMADSYRIEQVLVNILINAMKYGAGSPVSVAVRSESGKCIVEISDKGPGIREEDRERIFHRFERAVSSHEVSGLGLGLYIAREIMELHGGRVYVQSVLGQGSTFVMELPL